MLVPVLACSLTLKMEAVRSSETSDFCRTMILFVVTAVRTSDPTKSILLNRRVVGRGFVALYGCETWFVTGREQGC
jgi:hypothetical protein